MAELKYKPVPHNHKAFLARASTRKGFDDAYQALELEYQVAGQMLKRYIRPAVCELQVKLLLQKTA